MSWFSSKKRKHSFNRWLRGQRFNPLWSRTWDLISYRFFWHPNVEGWRDLVVFVMQFCSYNEFVSCSTHLLLLFCLYDVSYVPKNNWICYISNNISSSALLENIVIHLFHLPLWYFIILINLLICSIWDFYI